LDWCRDPKDNVFLDVAVAGNGEYIVTGDDDLKDDAVLKARMKNVCGVTIVGAPEFMMVLEERRGCWPFRR
jgi:predicted nucleic acid-binding protein